MHDAVSTWCAAGEQARADGFEHWPPEHPEPRGAKRLPAPGKGARNRSASAYLMPDCAGVVVKDWTTGERFTYWGNHQHAPDPLERRWNAQAASERQAKARAAQAERHRLGTLSARTAWIAAAPCTDHPYMVAKGERLPGCRVDEAGTLLVPRTDIDGHLIGLQRIDAAGGKRYWPGAPTAGTFYRLGTLADGETVIACEGAATGATLHRETEHAVACAMDAGNLLAVCRVLRARYPHADIVVAADDDRGTPGNPGRTKATAAAQAIGARLAMPSLCRCCTCSDSNDASVCERRRGVA